MVIQNISFGTISIMYSHLNIVDKKLIAKDLDVSHKILASWIQCIAYIRNLCAHHARVFNRNFTKAPIVKKGLEAHFSEPKRLYAQLYIIYNLLQNVSEHFNEWRGNIVVILEELDNYESNLGLPNTHLLN